jgi:hypothetical protein
MRKNILVPANKPRNPGACALTWLSRLDKRAIHKPHRQQGTPFKDLDQRVRESGEW